MKITIEVETETSKERVKAFVKQFCIDNFFKEAKVEIEE